MKRQPKGSPDGGRFAHGTRGIVPPASEPLRMIVNVPVQGVSFDVAALRTAVRVEVLLALEVRTANLIEESRNGAFDRYPSANLSVTYNGRGWELQVDTGLEMGVSRVPVRDIKDVVVRARQVAAYAHGGQRDKLGVPYFHHPRGVVEILCVSEEYTQLNATEKEDAVCAAYLHDVAEDTNLTLEDLLEMSFSEGTLKAVDAVTAREGEPKDAYYARVVAAGPVARALKLADLNHNNLACRRAMLPGAPGVPLKADDPKGGDMFTRLGKKYAKAYKALGADVPEHLLPFAE